MKKLLREMKETIDKCTEAIQLLGIFKQLELNNQRNCIVTYRIGEATEILAEKGIFTQGEA